jgi:SAM-dependent methyltransferase
MKKYLKLNKDTYDSLTEEYIEKYTEHETILEVHKKFLETIDKRFEGKNQVKILEIGPGIGEFLRKLEERGYNTIGVELSTNMAQASLKNSPNSIIINDDINNINFLPKQFDLIIALAVIHNFPPKDVRILLKNIYRWLKDDGYFIIDTTCHQKTKGGYYLKEDCPTKLTRYRHQWTKKDLNKMLNDYGFDIDYEFNIQFEELKEDWIEYLLKKK